MALMQKLVDKWTAMGLREALGKLNIICPGGKAEDQVEAIQTLKKRYSHSIDIWKIIPEGPANFIKSDDNVQFNCFMFCLDIRYGDIKELIGSNGMKIPNSDYMALLERNYLTEINWGSAVDGDYVLYFLDQKIVHAGKVKSGKVVSKWGNGHIWIHGVLEVPDSYGDHVKYYKRIEKAVCLKAFCEWISQLDN